MVVVVMKKAMFWYSVKEWNVKNKCGSCFVVWFGTGKFDIFLCFVEVLLLVWSFVVVSGIWSWKTIDGGEVGVLNCIATRFAEFLFITCAKILIIIIKLTSEVFKSRFEVIIIIKLRFEVLDCPCEL